MNKQLRHNINLIFIVTVILFFLQACSAGGGETGTGQTDTSVSVGVITGFGSVYVNGVKFKTNTNTKVSVDGATDALESQLSVGMLVTISGNVNADGITGSASSIVFEDNVEGLVVENTLATGGVLNVMGQTIIVDKDTVFSSKVAGIKIIEDIVIDQVVEVSGYSNGDGNIYATRVEVKSNQFIEGEIGVKGVVVSVTDTTFTVGGSTVNIIVDYAASELNGFSSTIQVGDYVSVKSVDGFNLSKALVASEIELKEKKRIFGTIETDKKIEFEGVVSQFDSVAKTFLLNAENILITDNTLFEKGVFTDIKNKTKLKIHGALNAEGVIVADSVKIKQVSETFYEGTITLINTDARFVELLGVRVYLNNSTRLIDDQDESPNDMQAYDRQYFNLGDLAVSDNVEISVFTDSDGLLVASKFERENKKMETQNSDGLVGVERKLEGVVSGYSVGSPMLTISGVRVNIQTALDNNQVSGLLVNGASVEIQGLEAANGWFAIEVSVEENTEEGDLEQVEPEEAAENEMGL